MFPIELINEIDEEIREDIISLNNNGFKTVECCSGHGGHPYLGIEFTKKIGELVEKYGLEIAEIFVEFKDLKQMKTFIGELQKC